MKIEIDDSKLINDIIEKVVDKLRPLLSNSCKFKDNELMDVKGLAEKMKAVDILDKVLIKPHVKNKQLDNYLTIFNSEEPTTSPKSLNVNMGDTGIPSSFHSSGQAHTNSFY